MSTPSTATPSSPWQQGAHYTGTITRWLEAHDYGFAVSDHAPGFPIFVHIQRVRGSAVPQRGDRVSFIAGQGRHGWLARKVVIL